MSPVRPRPEAPFCGRSSSGRARPCQGRGSEFEPRRPLQNTTLWVVFFCVRLGAHRRVSRLTAAAAADSRDTSSKAPRFIRRRRRFGAFLVARSKKNTPSDRMGCSFWKCAAAPESSLPRPARSASNQEVRQGSCEWRQPFVGCREASSSLVARSKKERHPTGCLSFLGNESGEARNELQLRAPRRGVEAGSNSPGDCCVRERRAEPRNRRGIEEYVKERIYIDGCTHFLPCDVREYRQQNLWVFFLEMCRSTGVYARCAGCQTDDGVVN